MTPEASQLFDAIGSAGVLFGVVGAIAIGQPVVSRLVVELLGRKADEKPVPYGVGPCGVARVTYPSSYGLTVTERAQ